MFSPSIRIWPLELEKYDPSRMENDGFFAKTLAGGADPSCPQAGASGARTVRRTPVITRNRLGLIDTSFCPVLSVPVPRSRKAAEVNSSRRA